MGTEERSIYEIKDEFLAVIRILQADIDVQSDWLDGLAKIAQLEIFLAHSQRISELDELLRFCSAVLDDFGASALPAERVHIFAVAERDLQSDQKVDLKSVLFATLANFHQSGASL